MLEDTLSSYKELAEQINWKQMNCNDLFFEYIKHEHDDLAMLYFAGIVCRYWGYAAKVYSQCNQHVPFDQCYDILINTINYVLEKRVWENESSSLYGDKTAPDKAFHMVLKRERAVILSRLNAKKRLSDFNTMSIDEMYDNFNDAAEGLFDIYDDSTAERLANSDLVAFIKNHDATCIIMLDAVCFKRYTSYQNLITNLKRMTRNDYDYYHDMYSMEKEAFFEALIKILESKSSDLQSELNKALRIAKEEYTV